jgi:predicted transport protein
LEKNLDDIFPGLQLVKSEYQIEEFRADTIAFDTERMSFVIIEYKNVKNKSVIDQGITYYNLLQENREAFVLPYQKEMGKLYDIKDVNWDETRVIFIAPSFTSYQRKASGYVGVPIELYEIRKYDEGIITPDRIESKPSAVLSSSKRAPAKPRLVTAEYSEEDYLSGKYDHITRTSETRSLYYKLRTMLLEKFEKLEVKQKKHYNGFYSKDDGSSVCTVEVQKHKMILTYSTTNEKFLPSSDFVKDFSKKGHWGIGNFRSEIRSEEDVMKAIPFVEKVYLRK